MHASTPTDWAETHLWERVGFMELIEFMGGCMGSFPGGSFCRLSGGEAARAVPAPHTTTKAALCKQSKMTVSAQRSNRYSWVQTQAAITRATIWTDKPQEWKAHPRSTTHIIILSNWVCNCPTLSLQCFYTSYKHSAQPRRHERTRLSWAAKRWRMDEAQGHGVAVVSEKKRRRVHFTLTEM